MKLRFRFFRIASVNVLCGGTADYPFPEALALAYRAERRFYRIAAIADKAGQRAQAGRQPRLDPTSYYSREGWRTAAR